MLSSPRPESSQLPRRMSTQETKEGCKFCKIARTEEVDAGWLLHRSDKVGYKSGYCGCRCHRSAVSRRRSHRGRGRLFFAMSKVTGRHNWKSEKYNLDFIFQAVVTSSVAEEQNGEEKRVRTSKSAQSSSAIVIEL
jgi:hypothetical protein